jgi:hypothetical protein
VHPLGTGGRAASPLPQPSPAAPSSSNHRQMVPSRRRATPGLLLLLSTTGRRLMDGRRRCWCSKGTCSTSCLLSLLN